MPTLIFNYSGTELKEYRGKFCPRSDSPTFQALFGFLTAGLEVCRTSPFRAPQLLLWFSGFVDEIRIHCCC